MLKLRKRPLFFSTIVAAVSVFIIVNSIGAHCESKIKVCPLGCDYKRIQPAIDDAEPGTTIIIKPLLAMGIPLLEKYLPRNVFRANLEINKPLTIRTSVPHSVVVKPKHNLKSAISLGSKADKVNIVGLDIVGSGGKRCTRGGMPKCPIGIYVAEKANLTLRNSSVTNNGGFGVRVNDSATATILNSDILNNKTGGILYEEAARGMVINNM